MKIKSKIMLRKTCRKQNWQNKPLQIFYKKNRNFNNSASNICSRVAFMLPSVLLYL